MKKTILSILAIALMAVTVSAKKKANNTVVLDFSKENPLTAVQGTNPEKVTIDTPVYGLEIPTKWAKTVETAESMGYISCPNPEKNEEGFYLPYSRQSFQSEGQTYEITIGTVPNKGRKAYMLLTKGRLSSFKGMFNFPEVKGMVPSGIKIHTVNNGKYVNERFVFRIAKGKISGKTEIAVTNPAVAEEETVMEAKFEGVQPGENIIVYTYTSFYISKIEFLYSPVPKAGKAAKK